MAMQRLFVPLFAAVVLGCRGWVRWGVWGV
jgi:hypothetical protein